MRQGLSPPATLQCAGLNPCCATLQVAGARKEARAPANVASQPEPSPASIAGSLLGKGYQVRQVWPSPSHSAFSRLACHQGPALTHSCPPFLSPPQTKNLEADYELGKVLGRGQFGTTRLARHRATSQSLACKSIAKRKLTSAEDVADVQREVQIMHHLKGHPNITFLAAVYEDREHIHILMDVCSGGELFDRITAKGYYRWVGEGGGEGTRGGSLVSLPIWSPEAVRGHAEPKPYAPPLTSALFQSSQHFAVRLTPPPSCAPSSSWWPTATP